MKQTAEDVEARRGHGMLGAERFLSDRQRPLDEWPAAGEVAVLVKQAGKAVETRGGRGVLGSECLFSDRQRPLVEQTRSGRIALRLMQAGEVVEDRRYEVMLGADAFSAIASARSRERRAPPRSPWP